jgi:large subunit ribosomal protein L29
MCSDMTRPSEFRELSTDELENRLTETREELFNLRFQNATGQLDNYRRLALLRRDVARISTILRERQLSGTGGGS